jgi:hypothetical protein
MKKIIYLCGMLLLLGTFSSFKATPSITKKIGHNSSKFITHVAGYFTKDDIIYEVWVEEEGVVAVLDYNTTAAIPVDSFSGTVTYAGLAHINVEYGSASFYYVGYLRATP